MGKSAQSEGRRPSFPLEIIKAVVLTVCLVDP